MSPRTAAGGLAADPFFLARGEVFLWGAWQGDVPRGPGRLGLDVPVAQEPGRIADHGHGPRRVRRPTRAPGLAEMPLQGNAYNSGQMPYAPVSLDDAGGGAHQASAGGRPSHLRPQGRLGVRRQQLRRTIPSRGGPMPRRSPSRAASRPSTSTSWSTRPRSPRCWGSASPRCAIWSPSSAMRPKTRAGNPNPLGPHIRFAMGTGVSQSGNFLKTFVHLGFNEDLEGRPVFDALFPLVAARQTNINARFAVPGRRRRPASRAPGLRPELSPRVRPRLPRRDPRQHRRHLQAVLGDEDDPEDLPRPERHGDVGACRARRS